jgi:hypothetical protein
LGCAGDHAANKPLGPLEEAKPVEQRVPDPDGDAVVGVVRAIVVDVVMLLGEDQTSLLKPGRGDGGSPVCAHLWNWFVRNTARQSRSENFAKRYPSAVASMGTTSQTKSMNGTLDRLLLPFVSLLSAGVLAWHLRGSRAEREPGDAWSVSRNS